MSEYDPLDPQADCFRPPAIPTAVGCLHCGEVYESYQIEWRVSQDADGKPHGFWCCPTEGCGGCGFGFDIFAVDPEYQYENGGWVWFDDEEGDDDDLDDAEVSEIDNAADPESATGDEAVDRLKRSNNDEELPW